VSGVHGALRALLEMDARGDWERYPRLDAPRSLLVPAAGVVKDTASSPAILVQAAHALLSNFLMLGGGEGSAGLLHRLRASGGLVREEEVALRKLLQRIGALSRDVCAPMTHAEVHAGVRHQAAADVARHGLRRCALPSCGATEPHHGFFKRCSRCRAVAYCGTAHQGEDWRRHKRAECTSAAAQPATDDAE
jgi:hypothetical protein